MIRSDEKIALITGGSSGIGFAVAKALSRENVHLILSARNERKLAETAFELRKENPNITSVPADLTRDEDIDYLIDYIRKTHERLDILVNNAGFGAFAPIEETTTMEMDDMWRVNVRAPFLLSRHLVPLMKKTGEGHLIFISSIAGTAGVTNGSAYSMTKFAVMGLSKSLYAELRDAGISVTAICPGSVDTPFFDGFDRGLNRDNMLKPDDVAKAVLFAIQKPRDLLIDQIELRPRKSPKSPK